MPRGNPNLYTDADVVNRTMSPDSVSKEVDENGEPLPVAVRRFITEDVHNTGESWIAFARMLMQHGVDVQGVATLASNEQRMASARDIERLSEKVANHLNKPLAEVQPVLNSLFDGAFKQLVNKAEADATRSRDKSARLFDIAAGGQRAGSYSNPLRNGGRGQGGLLAGRSGRQGEPLSTPERQKRLAESPERGYLDLPDACSACSI